jgi:hypothetical protein
MGKKLKITESQLKMLVENKNRKIVSEQPENELEQNPMRELSYEFRTERKDEYGILYLLRGKKSGEFGVFNKSKMDWEHGYQPSFKESDIKLYQTQNGDHVLIAKFKGIGDKVFYTMQNVDSDDSMMDIVKFLNTREHVEVVKNLKDIDTSDDSLPPSNGMRKRNNDRVYEESDMDEEIDRPSKEEDFTKQSELNEWDVLGVASMGAQKAAEDVARMLMNLEPQFVGPEEKGGVKEHYVTEFCKHLSNIILGKSTDETGSEMDSNDEDVPPMGGDMDNEMNESIQKIKSQFKRFL